MIVGLQVKSVSATVSGLLLPRGETRRCCHLHRVYDLTLVVEGVSSLSTWWLMVIREEDAVLLGVIINL